MGTDAGTPFNDHADIPGELEHLVAYGLDPAAALAAGTAESAALLGLADAGYVREGYRADLVVLDDDPADDAAAWRDLEAVVAGAAVV